MPTDASDRARPPATQGDWRARAADFAKWGAHGAEGWSFDDVLPVIPEIPSATTNVTVIMLAERIYQRLYAS